MLATIGLPVLIAALSADPCPPGEPAFYLDAAGASAGTLVLHAFGQPAIDLEVTARLRTAFGTQEGAWAWSISVAHDAAVLTLLEATHAGTDGFELIPGGFQKTDLVVNETGTGFVSGIAFSRFSGPSLPPRGDFSLARARYRLVPQIGSAKESDITTAIEFRDGLRGVGRPVNNRIVYHGDTQTACVQDLGILFRLEPGPSFIRGDANFDQEIDISDPTTILRALFHGDAPIRCDDAADANDDGQVDISDAIAVFGYLFLGDPPPPAPFPGAGPDPTPDALFCEP